MRATIEELRQMVTKEKVELVRRIRATASENEILYGGCARSTLNALQQNLGLGGEESFKAATFLAGGCARRAELCGALAGAIMALGIAFAEGQFEQGTFEERPLSKKSEAYQKSARLAGMVCDRFMQKFGSLRCKGVQEALHGRSWDFMTEELLECFKPEIHDKCGEVAGAAAEYAAECILAMDSIDK